MSPFVDLLLETRFVVRSLLNPPGGWHLIRLVLLTILIFDDFEVGVRFRLRSGIWPSLVGHHKVAGGRSNEVAECNWFGSLVYANSFSILFALGIK